MMALVFGCILTFFGFFNQCLCPLPCGQRLMDISGVGVQLSLALTWPMIRSSVCDENGGCRWGGGATALLLAQLFFFFASVFSRCMREPRHERRKEDKEEKMNGSSPSLGGGGEMEGQKRAMLRKRDVIENEIYGIPGIALDAPAAEALAEFIFQKVHKITQARSTEEEDQFWATGK